MRPRSEAKKEEAAYLERAVEGNFCTPQNKMRGILIERRPHSLSPIHFGMPFCGAGNKIPFIQFSARSLLLEKRDKRLKEEDVKR